MKHATVIFHSGYGHTKRLSGSVVEGLREVEGVEVDVVEISEEGEISDAQWDAMAQSDAIVFGSPTYMGGPSWQFKRVADASSKPWFEQKWKDKLAAGFTNSASMNGDKASTLNYFFTLAMQHAMVWVGTGMMPANKKDAERDDINYLGSYSGLMAQSPSDASAEEAPTQGDLDTAVEFGKRVASTLVSR